MRPYLGVSCLVFRALRYSGTVQYSEVHCRRSASAQLEGPDILHPSHYSLPHQQAVPSSTCPILHPDIRSTTPG
jgi:hypothetical protein